MPFWKKGKVFLEKKGLEKGEEYIFFVGREKKRGVFAGKYDPNGNVIIQTKKKGVWSIPVKELFRKSQKQ